MLALGECQLRALRFDFLCHEGGGEYECVTRWGVGIAEAMGWFQRRRRPRTDSEARPSPDGCIVTGGPKVLQWRVPG